MCGAVVSFTSGGDSFIRYRSLGGVMRKRGTSKSAGNEKKALWRVGLSTRLNPGHSSSGIRSSGLPLVAIFMLLMDPRGQP